MPANVSAVLVVPGDKPGIQPKTITQMLTAYSESAGKIIVPGDQLQYGYLMLIDRRFWQEIMMLP